MGKELPPVLDKESAIERMGGDPDIYRDVLAVFLEDVPIQLKKLDDELPGGQRSEVKRIAHSLKSASASIGGEAMSASASSLEEQSETAAEGELHNMRTLLHTEFERLRKNLTESEKE